jgi:hypothetical protein
MSPKGDSQPPPPANAGDQIEYGHALRLYEEVTAQIKKSSLEESEIRVLIEKADDAIKEFGSSNQDKKAELRRIKEQLQRSLPPLSFADARTRVEGGILTRLWKRTLTRTVVIIVIFLIVIFPIAAYFYKETPNSSSVNANSSPTPNNSPAPSLAAATPGVGLSPSPLPFPSPSHAATPVPITSPSNVAGNITQSQTEMDKAYSAVSQMRIGMRAGLLQLLELKSKSADENVRQRVKTLLETVAADYEKVAVRRLKEDGFASPVMEIQSNNVYELQGKPGLTAALVKVIRTEEELMQVAFAFLALREVTHQQFAMFDLEAVEKWCVSHKADCGS